MTNYRLCICEYHDKSWFNYCFTCGFPLKKDGDTLTCSKSWIHVSIFLNKHGGDLEKDDCGVLKIE